MLFIFSLRSSRRSFSPVLNLPLLLLRNEVEFVEQDLVCECYLLEGLVDIALGLDLVEVLLDVFAVGKADEGVNFVVVGHLGGGGARGAK